MNEDGQKYDFDSSLLRPSYIPSTGVTWVRLGDTALNVCEGCKKFTIYDQECAGCKNKSNREKN
jgi:hypothetical protein